MEHEDDLVDRRLKWAITISAFLFAAYGATWIGWPQGEGADLDQPTEIMFVYCIVRIFIGVCGYLSAIVSCTSIEAAHLAIRAVTRKYNTFVKANQEQIEAQGLQIWKLIGDNPTHLPGFVSSNYLPHGVAMVWTCLVLIDVLLLMHLSRLNLDLPSAPFNAAGCFVLLFAGFVLINAWQRALDCMARLEYAGKESLSTKAAAKGTVTRISEQSFEVTVREPQASLLIKGENYV